MRGEGRVRVAVGHSRRQNLSALTKKFQIHQDPLNFANLPKLDRRQTRWLLFGPAKTRMRIPISIPGERFFHSLASSSFCLALTILLSGILFPCRMLAQISVWTQHNDNARTGQ